MKISGEKKIHHPIYLCWFAVSSIDDFIECYVRVQCILGTIFMYNFNFVKRKENGKKIFIHKHRLSNIHISLGIVYINEDHEHQSSN